MRTRLVGDGDGGAWVSTQLGALPRVAQVHDELLDLPVVQQGGALPQLQQFDGYHLLGLPRLVGQIALHRHIVLRQNNIIKILIINTYLFKTHY